jgi:hypothetical protein
MKNLTMIIVVTSLMKEPGGAQMQSRKEQSRSFARLMVLCVLVLLTASLADASNPPKKKAAPKKSGKKAPAAASGVQGCSVKSYNLEKNEGMIPEQLQRIHAAKGRGGIPYMGTAADIDCDGRLEFAVAGDDDVGDFYHCVLYDDETTGFRNIPSEMWIGCTFIMLSERHNGWFDLKSNELTCGDNAPEDCRPTKCVYQWNGKKYMKKFCGK